MPALNDLVRVKYISEMNGQQLVNQQYFSVLDPGAANLNLVLDALATAYFASLSAILTSSLKLTCVIWENQTQPESIIVFPAGLVGTSGANSHPTFSVIHWEIYGKATLSGVDPIHRSRTFISGIVEERSLSGRIENPDSLNAHSNFLTNTIIPLVGGPNLQPVVRYRETVGPPATYNFVPVIKAVPSADFKTLRSRKTNLCSAT